MDVTIVIIRIIFTGLLALLPLRIKPEKPKSKTTTIILGAVMAIVYGLFEIHSYNETQTNSNNLSKNVEKTSGTLNIVDTNVKTTFDTILETKKEILEIDSVLKLIKLDLKEQLVIIKEAVSNAKELNEIELNKYLGDAPQLIFMGGSDIFIKDSIITKIKYRFDNKGKRPATKVRTRLDMFIYNENDKILKTFGTDQDFLNNKFESSQNITTSTPFFLVINKQIPLDFFSNTKNSLVSLVTIEYYEVNSKSSTLLNIFIQSKDLKDGKFQYNNEPSSNIINGVVEIIKKMNLEFLITNETKDKI